MPIQKGPNKMIGFIDGKIYYMMKGEFYVRNPSAPSKSKINNDPAYRSVKKNARKFGSASSMGTAFKSSFGAILDNVSDKGLHNRICGLFNKLILRNQEMEGVQSVEIRSNKDLFQDFQFKEKVNFNSLIKVPFILHANEERKRIEL